MNQFGIFQRVIADTVFGVHPSMVYIVGIVPDRRLREEEVPRLLPPRHPLPALRWLQSQEYDPYAPALEVVPQPTALERAGVKPDGKSGGPKMNPMTVNFQIMTGADKTLAWRCLREYNGVGMQAITFQLETIMGNLNMPRRYSIAIVSVTAHPATENPNTNATDSDGSGIASTSFASSPLRPKQLFSVVWRCALLGVVIAIPFSQWL